MNTTSLFVTLKLPVSPELIDGIFITATEGGVNHWCEETQNIRRESLINLGRIITSVDFREEDETEWYRVDQAKIADTLQKILDGTYISSPAIRESIVSAITEDDAGHIDSDGADCIIQYAALGEVRYS